LPQVSGAAVANARERCIALPCEQLNKSSDGVRSAERLSVSAAG
jgi:hypothetical protein